MAEIVVVMTCFNRKEKTVNCIKKLHEGNNHNKYRYIVVDDASTDGTKAAIEELRFSDVDIVEGTGSLFWNGGMHKGIQEALSRFGSGDYVLLVNDDVDFTPGIIDRMADYAKRHADGAKDGADKAAGQIVLVGATKSDAGALSYGGILYRKGLDYDRIGPDKPEVSCSTFNANCVLIPFSVMKKAGNIDSFYKHSMGDFDLGFRISRGGTPIYVYPEYVGRCNDNPKEGTWQDTSLPVRRRLKLKESFKGLPFRDWFHYLRKNFGFGTACVRSVTPYIKIFLRR